MGDRPCDICGGPSKALMCTVCCRSYDRNGHKEGSLHAALTWAAGRARRAQRTDLAAAQARAEALAARVAELEASCEIWATLVNAAEAERDAARAQLATVRADERRATERDIAAFYQGVLDAVDAVPPHDKAMRTDEQVHRQAGACEVLAAVVREVSTGDYYASAMPSADEAREELRAAGLDPDIVGARGAELVRRMMAPDECDCVAGILRHHPDAPEIERVLRAREKARRAKHGGA